MEVWREINSQPHEAEQAAGLSAKLPQGNALDEPTSPVIGVHGAMVGDSDIMTTGDSSDHERDDTAMRNIRRATKLGETADEAADLVQLRDSPTVHADAGGQRSALSD